MKEPLSPPIQVPLTYHRHIKSWAAQRGMTLREAVTLAIREMAGPVPPLDTDPRQLRIPGSDPTQE